MVIITGANGFVGTNLSRYLTERGFLISPLSLRGNSLPELPKAASAIIHLAGKAHDLKNQADDEEYFRVNSELTHSLFDAFLQSNIEDFFYFSSVKAAADKVIDVLTEDVVPTPATAYGRSKLAAEAYLISQSLPKGKRLFIIRPCMIHGPGNKGNLNLLYSFIQKGLPYPLASFDNERSFLSIDNLCYTLNILLTNKDIHSDIFNLSDDEPLSTNEVLEIICDTIGKKKRLLFIPKKAIKIVARFGDWLKLPLNSERLQKLTESYVVSNEKLKKALLIDKLPTSATAGLITTIKSFDSAVT